MDIGRAELGFCFDINCLCHRIDYWRAGNSDLRLQVSGTEGGGGFKRMFARFSAMSLIDHARSPESRSFRISIEGVDMIGFCSHDQDVVTCSVDSDILNVERLGVNLSSYG